MTKTIASALNFDGSSKRYFPSSDQANSFFFLLNISNCSTTVGTSSPTCHANPDTSTLQLSMVQGCNMTFPESHSKFRVDRTSAPALHRRPEESTPAPSPPALAPLLGTGEPSRELPLYKPAFLLSSRLELAYLIGGENLLPVSNQNQPNKKP